MNQFQKVKLFIHLEEAYAFVERIGYPVIVRPAYTLGGTGGGICDNEEELNEIVASGLKYSPVTQCLLEKSIAGFKEIEYEVMRDANDNAIVVCNMENIDPVGVHTGDSIVVAPSQTLSDREYQMLTKCFIKNYSCTWKLKVAVMFSSHLIQIASNIMSLK